MIKSLVLFVCILIMPFIGHAVHLVGGVISYEHTEGSNYEVTLKVYRDCNGGGAAFDGAPGSQGPAILGVFTGSNTLWNTYEFNAPGITNIDPSLSGLCESISIPACVEEGVYVITISLPSNTSGYQLVYQRCCRNGTIDNIITPEDTGNTFTAFVPPLSDFASNSSPVFNNFPPVALCLNNPLEFNHAASDIDGDSLVYSFCTPFGGANPGNPQPNPPSNPAYNPINWAGGYNVDYQIDASPIFNIDPNTGFLTGTPTQQGQYVIGICVQEFRDGVFVSEVRRDFQFNVLICPSQPIAVFAEATVISDCTSEVTFENNSENASDFIWYFGDGESSTEFEPTHTYLEGGVYEVMLVVGTSNCSDTTISVITLNTIPDPVLTDPVFQCLDGEEVYSIEIETIDLFDLEYVWTLDGNETFGGSTTIIDNIVIDEPGDHVLNVTVTDPNGCGGSDEVIITINPSPVANFMVTDGPCAGTVLNFSNASTDAESIEWDFGFDGEDEFGNGDNVLVTFPFSGEYIVSITASGTNVCDNTYTESIVVSEELFIELSMPEPQCQVGNSSDFIPVGNFAEPATFLWTIEDAEDFDTGAPYLNDLSVTQGGNHSLELLIVDGNGCELSVIDEFLTVDPLVVNFETAGTGCAPYTAFFDNNTTGGFGLEYEWNFGDGQSSTSPSPFHTFEGIGSFDVSLTVNSTVGCIESASTTQIEALTTFPSPSVGFTVFPLEVNILNPEVTITSDDDSLDCNFYFSDGEYYEDCNFNHTFNDAGLFDITQYITNEYGCSNSTVRTVRVNGHLFYAPSAVTMNDDGLNDFFRPSVLGDIAEYDLEIYDRYGSIVFKTNDPKEGWRPLYSHDGLFNFRVRVRDRFNIPAEYFGSFITIR